MTDPLERDLRRLAERGDVRGAEEVWHRATHPSRRRRVLVVAAAAVLVALAALAGSLALDDGDDGQIVTAGSGVSLLRPEGPTPTGQVLPAGDRLVAVSDASLVTSDDGRRWAIEDLASGSWVLDHVEGRLRATVTMTTTAGSITDDTFSGTSTQRSWTTDDGESWLEVPPPTTTPPVPTCDGGEPLLAVLGDRTYQATCSTLTERIGTRSEVVAEAGGGRRFLPPFAFRGQAVAPVVDADGRLVHLVVVSR